MAPVRLRLPSTDQYLSFVIAPAGMFLLFCRTVIDHYMTTGYPLSSSFYHLLTGNALNLVIADGILVGSSFGAYVFAKGMQKGWWGYGWTVVGIQHLMQTLYLAVTVKYTVESDAWWTQSGYLVLHCLSMMMKIHSCKSPLARYFLSTGRRS